MKNFLTIVIIFTTLFANMAMATGGPDHIGLIIDTTIDEHVTGNTNVSYGIMEARLEQQFPDTSIYPIMETKNEIIRNRLEDIMDNPNIVIDFLYISSHGVNSFLINQDGEFAFHLDREEDYKSIFGSAIGRFSKGAKIFFSGCSVSPKNRNQAHLLFKTISKNFKLKSGSIYANYTEGFQFTDAVILQSIGEQPTRKHRNKKLFFTLSAFVSYPLGLFYEKFLTNKGYLFRINGDKWSMEKENFFDVRKIKTPILE